jgi:uncharacterized protein YecT (DUF1311 family)
MRGLDPRISFLGSFLPDHDFGVRVMLGRRLLQVVTGFSALIAVVAAQAADDARYGAEYQACAKGSTVDIEQCVGRLTKAWDQRLNAAYQKLLKNNAEADKLRVAERLWVQFRDANCGYYGSGEGTIRRLEYAECMHSMTAHRALELEDLAKGEGG